MAYLPSAESTDLATRADFHALDTRIDVLESRIDTLEANLTARIDALGTRIDRIVLAVVAALVVITARTFF